MSGLLLFSFLLACAVGAIAAWRLSMDELSSRVVPLFLLSTAGIAGTLVVAAEVSSPWARYLSLIALILASASFCGGYVATRKAEKSQQAAKRP